MRALARVGGIATDVAEVAEGRECSRQAREALERKQPIGRLITDPQPDCIYYVDIALLPETRRGGIATALMTAVLDEPRQLGLPARVKVLSHNVPSLRLCQRIGFAPRAEIPPFVELEWHAQNDRTG